MLDLRLYYNTFQYKDTLKTIELVKSNRLDDTPVGYLQTLGNKVVKYLLTTMGTDVFDPSYGAYTAGITQFNRSYLPRYVFEFTNDIKRCTEFIQRSETPGPNGERLAAIKLIKITYDQETKPNEVYRFIEIVTTDNQRALVAVPHNVGT
jgi:hypothetical protein